MEVAAAAAAAMTVVVATAKRGRETVGETEEKEGKRGKPECW